MTFILFSQVGVTLSLRCDLYENQPDSRSSLLPLHEIRGANVKYSIGAGRPMPNSIEMCLNWQFYTISSIFFAAYIYSISTPPVYCLRAWLGEREPKIGPYVFFAKHTNLVSLYLCHGERKKVS